MSVRYWSTGWIWDGAIPVSWFPISQVHWFSNQTIHTIFFIIICNDSNGSIKEVAGSLDLFFNIFLHPHPPLKKYRLKRRLKIMLIYMLQTNIHNFFISSRTEKQDWVFFSFPLLTVNFLKHIKFKMKIEDLVAIDQ